MPEETKLNGETVDIIEEADYLTYPKVNQPLEMMRITYQYQNYPPRTIFVKKAEWTKDNKAGILRKDIAQIKAPTAATVEL